MIFLKLVGLLVLLLIVGMAALIANSFMGRQSIPDGCDVNGLRIVKDSFVSVGLLPLADGSVALFDAGNDKAGKAILSDLSRRGLGPESVKTIFLTHGHPDHMGAVPLFPKAEVMALSDEVAIAEGRASAGSPLTRLMPLRLTGVKISRALDDGEVVDLGAAKVQVFAVPGHTPGSAAYLVNGVLLLGDAADACSDGGVRGSPWLASADQAQDRASLRRLAERLTSQGGVQAVVCAHSGLIKGGLPALESAARGW